jgi:hypothetical protein
MGFHPLIIAERAGSDDLRYRLVGTRILRAHCVDCAGWPLSDLARQHDALAEDAANPI